MEFYTSNFFYFKQSVKFFAIPLNKLGYSSSPGFKLDPSGSRVPIWAFVPSITTLTNLRLYCGSMNAQSTVKPVIKSLISFKRNGLGFEASDNEIAPDALKLKLCSK